MPCLLVLLGLMAPRLILLILAVFTNWWSAVFNHGYLWPVLGWFFMPLTTLAYMMAMIFNDHTVSGGYLVMVIIAVVLDLTSHGATASTKSSSSG